LEFFIQIYNLIGMAISEGEWGILIIALIMLFAVTWAIAMFVKYRL
jgi:hypothetical protein